MVHHELAAAFEHVEQADFAVRPLELVLLIDPDHRQAAAVRVEAVAGLRRLLSLVSNALRAVSHSTVGRRSVQGGQRCPVWFEIVAALSSAERVLLALVALAMTVGAVELVRREVVLRRRTREPWTRLDASAGGPFFTALAAAAAWVLVVSNHAPAEGLLGLLAWLPVMVFLLVSDDRVR